MLCLFAACASGLSAQVLFVIVTRIQEYASKRFKGLGPIRRVPDKPIKGRFGLDLTLALKGRDKCELTASRP